MDEDGRESNPPAGHIPTSEAGSPGLQESQVNENDLKWMKILEQQNKNFLALLEAVKTPSVSTNIVLPEFDPDRKNVDARAWVSTADMCMADQPLVGASLMIALTKSLKGEASVWLSQVTYQGMTWYEFKDLFTSRYDCPETAAAQLIGLSTSKPKDSECLASYAATLMTSLMSRWKDLSKEQIAIATVMAHLAQLEPRIQRLAFTTNIESRNQLQQELKAMSFMKRRLVTDDKDGVDAKRNKPTPNQQQPFKCYVCGKTGHKASSCHQKKENRPSASVGESSGRIAANAKPSSTVVCFRCQQVGHIASKCPGLSSRDGNKADASASERRVDLCTVVTPSGTLRHSGEQISFNYDSGSECSLVKESVSGKFHGKRFNNVVTMTGIGQTSVASTLQILTTVEIDDISLEILFHVLPDCYLRSDVMIGREILSQGLAINMTSDTLHIQKVCSVNACDINSNSSSPTESPINFDLIDTDIPLEYKPKLISTLNKFKQNFVNGTPSTPANVEPMQIRLKDVNKTVCRRPYRLSPDERQVVRGKVSELLASNIIRPSSSPFASPILLVKKKDGSDRMCVDYRELNDNTVPDRFPLPLISDQIDRLAGCHYFTVLDMASGYHQVPVHPDSIEKTAFVTPEGQFEYLTMPFGLRNAPSVFQRAVVKALGELVNTYVVVYMDDILVLGGPNIDEALDRVHTVLDTLTKQGFSFNLKKCTFFKQRVEYLGFEVCRGEIRPNPKKVDALVSLPPPQTVTQLRQFIGLASYFRRFIPNFSRKMAPLYALTSTNKGNINWTPDHESIRKEIVSVLTSEPVLTIFDANNPIELHTDASSIGYGAVLMQIKDGKRHVIAYFSKRTTAPESRYHSYELETLAVVNAVKHFRHYLHGKFTVVTDCNSLQASRRKLDLTPRVHRWWAFLQAYDFDIIHKDGSRMAHADFFSRNPLPDPCENSGVKKVNQMEVNVNTLPDNWLLAEQQRDPELSKLLADLNSDKLSDDIAKTYEIRAGILYRKVQRKGRSRCLPILPRALRWSVINTTHSSLQHLGYEKTLEKVCDQFWFEHMARYVRKFVDNCTTCKIAKSHSGKVSAELHPIPKVAVPWHTIHIDATGKLSGKNDRKEYVFVLIDAFTKFVLLHHTMNIDTVNSIKAVKLAVSLFGAPVRIIADQGRCFASGDFREFCSSHNISLHLIATGSSRANGQVERTMSTLKNMLTAVETSRECSWQEALSDVQLALNCSVNRVTKFSPLELLIGKVARPLDLMFVDDECDFDLNESRTLAIQNMEANAKYDKVRFDKTKSKVNRFSVGDFVLLKNEERNQTKLDPKYKGPFRVSEVLEGDRYVLKALNSRRTYKYAHDRLRKMPESSSTLSDSNESDSN